MSDAKLRLELEPQVDKYGNKYYIAKLKGPILIDCHEDRGGVAFMVFVAEEGHEELQISTITSPKTAKTPEVFNKFRGSPNDQRK